MMPLFCCIGSSVYTWDNAEGWGEGYSIMLELVLHTSCNFNNRLNLCLANLLARLFISFFFEGVETVAQPAFSHWASLMGVLITLMSFKLSPSIRPARAWVWFGRVSVISN